MSADPKRATVTIRSAVKSDCRDLCRLIKELANDLNSGHQTKLTEEVLENDGFGEKPLFQCLVAEHPGNSEAQKDTTRLVGYALCCFTYSSVDARSFFIEDFYVAPEFRSHGLGTRLLKAAAKFGLDNGCTRLWWNSFGDNIALRNYYKRCGGEDLTELEGWHPFRMTKSAMEKFVNK